MRQIPITKSLLVRWLPAGCVLGGLLQIASCSSEDAPATPTSNTAATGNAATGNGVTGNGVTSSTTTNGSVTGNAAGTSSTTTGNVTCEAPTQACNGGCADFSTDAVNCGGCGTACVAGQTCQDGACTLNCVAPQIDCDGQCADPASNALHCGGCNQACDDGEICQGSTCMTGSCPDGETLCNGACVDTDTDALNCGDCGAPCNVDQTCEAGVCAGGTTTTTATSTTSTTGDSTSTTGDATTTGAGGSTSTTGDNTSTSTTGGQTGECRVWMAPNGNDSNDGSEGSPVASLLAAYNLMCPVPPSGSPNGTECLGPAPRTICVKPGTYEETERVEFKKTRMGTASNRLTLQGDPNSSERPLFDFSGQPRLECGDNPDNIGGITINAHYVTIKNIAVTGANDNCILLQGYEGIAENVLTYACADTGLQISDGDDYMNSGVNNAVINCDSHSNNDIQCDGENADGFAVKEGSGSGNSFTGCRAWNNADDGWDLYAWATPVTISDSWAFNQCATTEGGGSDCNGFKLGGDGVSASHILSDLIAVGNTGDAGGVGFTDNDNPASMNCSGTCASWGNDTAVQNIMGISTSAISGANVDNMAADSARNADGSLKAITAL